MATNFRSLVLGGYFSSSPFDRTVPVSIRCNNPGAINGANWEKNYPGYVDTVETTPGNKTTIFEAPEFGVAVWWELLRRYAANNVRTIGGIITQYGGGQDYSNYVRFVESQSGLGENREVPLDDDSVLLAFGKAMFHYEAGRATPLSDKQILYGFRLGRADGEVDDVAAALGAPAANEQADYDPGVPAPSQFADGADVIRALRRTNFGSDDTNGDAASVGARPLLAAAAGAPPELTIDVDRAQAFLHACQTSSPRVTYGLGAKMPALEAVPGRDFTKIDCSGFVRATIRLSTNPPAPFPDGSVVQHDWVTARGFKSCGVEDGFQNDGSVRIAFLRPQDSPSGVGHVALIVNAQTLESHGGVGPDSRPWTGKGWQSKVSMFVLTQGVSGHVDSTQKRPLTFSFDRGQLPTIACVNIATVSLGVDWNALISALGDYVNKAFSPIWGTPAKIIDAGKGPVPAGCWGLVFMDDADQPDALGYHDLTNGGLPLSKIFVRTIINDNESVSVTASHEVAEMLVDPGIQIAAAGPDGATWYAYETADAVESESFEVSGIPMSNFVFPSWFEGFRAPRSTKFDYLDHCVQPFELRPGGYISVYKDGAWTQKFGSAEAENRFNLQVHPRAAVRGRSMRHRSIAKSPYGPTLHSDGPDDSDPGLPAA